MADALVFQALSYGVVGLLALAALVVSVVSLRKETISEQPLHGLISVLLLLAALCASIALFAAYIHFLQVSSILLRWETAAFTFTNERHLNIAPTSFNP
jgi:hypothetical protein